MVLPLCSFMQFQAEEYQLKAAFLERFTRFIDWPNGSDVENSSRPFVIGVLGENPFDEILEEIYSKQKIKNKYVKTIYISEISEINKCNLVFISKSYQKKIQQVISYTKNKPILTVSDSKDFAKKGVLINFIIKDNKLRFEINGNAVKQSGLKISHLLMQQAIVVGDSEDGR